MPIKRYIPTIKLLQYDGTNSAEILASCGHQAWQEPDPEPGQHDRYPYIDSEEDGVLVIKFESPWYNREWTLRPGDCIPAGESIPEYVNVFTTEVLGDQYVAVDDIINE